MVDFTGIPNALTPNYRHLIRSALLTGAVGDALGYPVELLSTAEITSRGGASTGHLAELIVSDDTQLTCYTLDALTEVLEWNNQGDAVDELACLWLAYLRWYRGMGYPIPENAPVPQTREIDSSAALTDRQGPGKATLKALASGHLQTATNTINPDALGTGALVRSCVFGMLPVATERTAVLLAVRGAALTHGHPEALASAAAYTLLMRHILGAATQHTAPTPTGEPAPPANSRHPLAEAVQAAIDWCSTVANDNAIPADASATAAALTQALTLRNTAPSAATAAQYFGTDWLCPTVLGIATWNALHYEATHPNGADAATLLTTLENAVLVDSDSDSIGAILGTLLGARYNTGGALAETIGTIRGVADIEAVVERYLSQLTPN